MISNNHKKYSTYKDKWIHFGDVRYDDYTTHRDLDRRDAYRNRASRIVNILIKIKIMPIFGHITNLLW